MDTARVKESINNPRSRAFLNRAADIHKRHDLHITGNGLQMYLDKIEGVEDDNAVSLRRALAKEATVPVMGNVLDPVNKVFTAQGGGRFYDINSEEQKRQFINYLDSATITGESLNSWFANVWKDNVNLDSNGLAFVEVSEDGTRAYITYKSSGSIVDVKKREQTIYELILIHGTDDRDNTIYRYIDANEDTLFSMQSGLPVIVNSLPNYWGRVPARFLSNRIDKKTGDNFQTWVHEAMPVCDELLLDHTIYNIYKVKQGIPYVWEYDSECATCEGSGQIESDNGTANCGVCGGSGSNPNRSVGEVRRVPVPEDGDPSVVPVAGYIQPDLATWEQMEKTQEKEEDKAYSFVWGRLTDAGKSSSNTTAYEIGIRVTSQRDRLDMISRNAEQLETFITDLLGEFYLGNSYGGAIVSYGRKYITMEANQVWEEYTKALESNVTSTELNQLLESYYYSLHSQNPKKLRESLNKLYTKPFFHNTPEQLQNMRIIESDYLKNIYYDEFVVEFEKTNSISTSTVTEIQTALNNYITSKETINQTTTE